MEWDPTRVLLFDAACRHRPRSRQSPNPPKEWAKGWSALVTRWLTGAWTPLAVALTTSAAWKNGGDLSQKGTGTPTHHPVTTLSNSKHTSLIRQMDSFCAPDTQLGIFTVYWLFLRLKKDRRRPQASPTANAMNAKRPVAQKRHESLNRTTACVPQIMHLNSKFNRLVHRMHRFGRFGAPKDPVKVPHRFAKCKEMPAALSSREPH